jgi:hypothetical protein
LASTRVVWSSVPRHASRQPSYEMCSCNTRLCLGSGSPGGLGSAPRAGQASRETGRSGDEFGRGIINGRGCSFWCWTRARRRTRTVGETPVALYEKARTCDNLGTAHNDGQQTYLLSRYATLQCGDPDLKRAQPVPGCAVQKAQKGRSQTP